MAFHWSLQEALNIFISLWSLVYVRNKAQFWLAHVLHMTGHACTTGGGGGKNTSRDEQSKKIFTLDKYFFKLLAPGGVRYCNTSL